MKKIIITAILIIFLKPSIYSQEETFKVSDFNGIYETQDKNGYLIFKNGLYIEPYFLSEERVDIGDVSYYGFCIDTIKYGKGLGLSKKDIKSETVEGYKLFVKGEPIENEKDTLNVMTYEYEYSKGSDVMILFGPKDLFYFRKDKLSSQREKLLRTECKKKNIDIDYFLGKEKRASTITTPKAIIYTEPNKPSKMFLVKGDTLTVLQEKDNWVYILYVTSKGKEIKGWIKKEDVSSN